MSNAKSLENAKARAPGYLTAEQVIDPIEILDSILAKFGKTALDPGEHFKTGLPTDGPQLCGDPTMFEQAELNLPTNASLHGGPNLTTVSLDARQKSQMLNIVVSDDGKGIAPWHFDCAMGRFSQIGPSAGSGLGLPIAKAVADSHGGELFPSQSEGCFSVTLRVPFAHLDTYSCLSTQPDICDPSSPGSSKASRHQPGCSQVLKLTVALAP